MGREVVDIALLEVETAAGSVVLQEVMTFDLTETDPGAEVVKTMRRSRRGIGFKRGVPDFEVDLEVKPVNPPEVDWLSLKQSGELIQMFYEDNDGGQRFQVRDCLVTEVSRTRNAEGEATDSIKILALDHFPEP